MTAPETAPPCVGMAWLFDSTEIRDHHAARQICDTCPVIDWCRERLTETMDRAAWRVASGGGPVGTWAGMLVGSPRKAKEARDLEKHGTEAGYYRHRHHKQASCKPCKKAHSEAQAERKARQRAGAT